MSAPQQRAAVEWWAERQREAETMLRACKLAEAGEIAAALALLTAEPAVPADGSER